MSGPSRPLEPRAVCAGVMVIVVGNSLARIARLCVAANSGAGGTAHPVNPTGRKFGGLPMGDIRGGMPMRAD
jgi:hypothetical protein